MPRRVISVALVAVAALACNTGLGPTPACPAGFQGICGTVTFRGGIPDSTDAVFVVAFATFPTSASELFSFRPALPPAGPGPTPLLLGGASAFYTIPLSAGRYEWVVAVWKKLGTLSPQTATTLLAETGFFRDATDTTKPGVVVVTGTATEHVDFVIDFTQRHPICTYFPPCP